MPFCAKPRNDWRFVAALAVVKVEAESKPNAISRVKKAEELFGEYKNSCEKKINININIPENTKVNLNINIKSKEDQELEDLEKEFIDILNKK